MSLFDVIKYPISMPPTIEELNALPDEIVREWMSQTTLSTNVSAFFYSISTLYAPGVDRQRVEILRKIIKEYDESI